MEVTTVSPPTNSSSEGDSLCEIDVTNVAIHIVTLLICLCGLAGNGAVLCLINLKSGNYGIFDLALADFLFLLLTVPTAFLFLVEDVSCSPIVPLMYMRFLFQLSVVSYYWGMFRLMRRSPVLYMDELCKLCFRCHLPQRLYSVVDSFESWAFFIVFAVIPAVTFLCTSHEQKQCQAALISMYTIILFVFAAPLLISHTIDFIKAKWGSQQQQQPKRRDIVIILVVLFTVLLSFCNFLQQLGYILVYSQVVFLLTCIYSSIKPFFYFLVGRCWRPCSVESFKISLERVFD